MRIVLPLMAALSLILSACAGVVVPSGIQLGTQVGAPTPCGTPTPTPAGESSLANGGTGVAGSGTGIDLTVSPEDLLTSEAAFAKANRTGPGPTGSVTPGPLLPPGSEQPVPYLGTPSPTVSPTATGTQFLSPNNAPTEPVQALNLTPTPCG